ncbi:MAG: 50S ribosomal protein L37ae [Candidatus Aenigmatarchaeota archaeon]
MEGGSAKRYGARYGKRIRNKVSEVEKDEKSRHTCPECGSKSLKREAKGIWKCENCGKKTAGGAWRPKTEGEEMVKKALKKSGDDE